MGFALRSLTGDYASRLSPIAYDVTAPARSLPQTHGLRIVHTQPERSSHEIPCGRGTILAVDDESMVRQLMVAALRKQGYDVIEASNGTEALRIIEEQGDRIDLMVSDVVMPRIGGQELARRLHESKPNAAVLLVTGCSEQMVTGTSASSDAHPLLHKPFRSSDFVDRVNSLLENRAAL